MSKTNDSDISNAELLEAIHAAFAANQEQQDQRFTSTNGRIDALEANMNQRFE